MEFHPLSNIFPLLEGDEIERLGEDIKKNGLLEPIWIYEGKILDGRNRYRACRSNQIEPKFQDFNGDDPLGFVVSKNLHRRHLDESQRAMAAARIANLKRGDNQFTMDGSIEPSITQTEARKLLNVGRESVKRAVKVQHKGVPEIINAVERGRMAVTTAAQLVDFPRDLQREAFERASQEVKEGKITATQIKDTIGALGHPDLIQREEKARENTYEPEVTARNSPRGCIVPKLCHTRLYTVAGTRKCEDQDRRLTLSRDITNAAEQIADFWDEDGYVSLIKRLAIHATKGTLKAVIAHYQSELDRRETFEEN